MVSEISEYKGKKVLQLRRSPEDKYGISFGLFKAKLILEHLKEITEFVQENDQPKEEVKDNVINGKEVEFLEY